MKILKKWQIILICLGLVFTIVSCKGKNTENNEAKEAEATESKTADVKEEVKPVTPEQAGYAFGVILAKTVKDSGIELNSKEFLKGYKAAMKEGFEEKGFMDAEKVLQQAFQEAHVKKMAEKLEASKKFLEEN